MEGVNIPAKWNIPVIEQWQLQRILDKLQHESHSFPGLWIQAFFIRPTGIDQVDFRFFRPVIVKTMDDHDLRWFKDTLFTQRHKVLQTNYGEKVLLTGFWSDNQDALEAWIKEQIPDDDTTDNPARIFIGRILLE